MILLLAALPLPLAPLPLAPALVPDSCSDSCCLLLRPQAVPQTPRLCSYMLEVLSRRRSPLTLAPALTLLLSCSVLLPDAEAGQACLPKEQAERWAALITAGPHGASRRFLASLRERHGGALLCAAAAPALQGLLRSPSAAVPQARLPLAPSSACRMPSPSPRRSLATLAYSLPPPASLRRGTSPACC